MLLLRRYSQKRLTKTLKFLAITYFPHTKRYSGITGLTTSWEANQLSFVGRVTLAKSVIEAVTIYHIMTDRIPKGCLEEIQRLQRSFIWGVSDRGRRYHALSWDKVTKPKCHGGLGLHRLDIMNQACIFKLGWKLVSGANDRWCEVMCGKYDCRTLKGENSLQNSASSLWKFIIMLILKLSEFCHWAIGDGTDVDAWRHVWIDKGVRIEDMVEHIPAGLQDKKVYELNENGKWNWSILQDWLPTELIHKIAAE